MVKLSAYDAYWSVAPIALVVVWGVLGGANPWRVALVCALVSWWGVRLTYNWARGWTGMDHEDWRYVDLRNKTGKLWPVVNLGGIHLFPTVQVFAGLLPAHAALTTDAPLSGWDIVAVVVTGGAILLEQVSDRQLHDYRISKPAKGSVLNTGVWAYSRHPNYVGEALFWWGLYFFSLAVGGEWWRVTGALAITLMFRFISIPMIEARHRARRPNYDQQAARGVFLPLRARSSAPND